MEEVNIYHLEHTSTFCCDLFWSVSSSYFRSLYIRVWIRFSGVVPVDLENSSMSSRATIDSQLTKSRGISLAREM